MMKKYIAMGVVLLLAPAVLTAAWRTKLTKSNGTTAVTIVEAPAASTSRTVPASGGVTVCNNGSSTVVFRVQHVTPITTNILEKYVTLSTNETYQSTWVTILDTTTNTLELVGWTAFSTNLDITTRWRDEGQ